MLFLLIVVEKHLVDKIFLLNFVAHETKTVKN